METEGGISYDLLKVGSWRPLKVGSINVGSRRQQDMECDSRKQAVNETNEGGVPPRAGELTEGGVMEATRCRMHEHIKRLWVRHLLHAQFAYLGGTEQGEGHP